MTQKQYRLSLTYTKEILGMYSVFTWFPGRIIYAKNIA